MGAGGKRRASALADSGRFPMAWLPRPCFRGDLFLCTDVLPSRYFGLCTVQIVNLQCGASRSRACNAVCSRSLPCVGRVDEGSTRRLPGRGTDRDRPLKPVLQKRIKRRTDCGGNHLGCSTEAGEGLQCGLSGNRVARPATARRKTERGTASIGNERCLAGKSNPHLSRKIYFLCCR